MEMESLTISLPAAMKAFIKAKLGGGRFSTPSEYIRSLIRADQEQSEPRDLEPFIRRGLQMKELPELSVKDWAAVEGIILRRSATRNASKREALHSAHR